MNHCSDLRCHGGGIDAAAARRGRNESRTALAVPFKRSARWPASPCLASPEIAVGDLDVILVSPGRARAGDRRPGAVAEISAQAFTLIAGGDAGWLSDDVPSILGRPALSCQQFAGYARVSPRLLV